MTKPANLHQPPFTPGETYIPVTGKVYNEEEVNNAIEAAKDGWWTEGRWADQFVSDFKKFLGVKFTVLVNSGSSANLLALSCLTNKVFGERTLKAGDEFITTPVGFPTTVNPAIIYGLKPVFVDAEIDSFNIDASKIEKAITKKTKLIMIAHTLGKPFNLEVIVKLARKHNIWLIEDCCDALGSTYNNQLCGTFGDLATYSFYPAHQITMGEGGAVVTNNPHIYRSMQQFRDWGRDCWCDPGQDNTCGKRFQWQLGDLPFGYDHKYTYSQIGYNLKLTDFQAAIGCAQLKKAEYFIAKRRENFKKWYTFFKKYEKWFMLLKLNEKENPSWFGFPISVRPDAPFTRTQLTMYLEENKIGTRNVFAGNLLRHPGYKSIKKRIIGKIKVADHVLFNGFWLGVYPGIDSQRMKYMQEVLEEFFAKYK